MGIETGTPIVFMLFRLTSSLAYLFCTSFYNQSPSVSRLLLGVFATLREVLILSSFYLRQSASICGSTLLPTAARQQPWQGEFLATAVSIINYARLRAN
jgi:hypothetical protein